MVRTAPAPSKAGVLRSPEYPIDCQYAIIYAGSFLTDGDHAWRGNPARATAAAGGVLTALGMLGVLHPAWAAVHEAVAAVALGFGPPSSWSRTGSWSPPGRKTSPGPRRQPNG